MLISFRVGLFKFAGVTFNLEKVTFCKFNSLSAMPNDKIIY